MTDEAKKRELTRKLDEAQRKLDESIVVVARCADELSEDSYMGLDGVYVVDVEHMVELRNALAHWKACTEKWLEAANEVGEYNASVRTAASS